MGYRDVLCLSPLYAYAYAYAYAYVHVHVHVGMCMCMYGKDIHMFETQTNAT